MTAPDPLEPNTGGHRTRGYRTRGHSRLAAVVFGSILALGAIALFQKALGWDEPCGREWSNSVNLRGETTEVTLRSGRCRLEAKLRGDVRFSPEEDAVSWVGSDGFLEIEHKTETDAGRVTHELSARPGSRPEAPELVYRRDGETLPLDAEGRTWLRGVAEDLFRRVGIDAEARAERIWKRGGAEALAQEIGRIEADRVAVRYLGPALRRGDPAEISRVFAAASRKVESDYETAGMIVAAAEGLPAGADLPEPLLAALGEIGSDYELRRAVTSLVEAGRSTEDLAELARIAAESMGSDYDLAQTLIAILRGPFSRELSSRELSSRELGDDALPAEVEEAVRGSLDRLGSEYERERVLEVLGSTSGSG